MKPKVRHVLPWLFGLLAAGLATLNVAAWNHAQSMTHYTRGGTRTPQPERLTGWAKAKVLLFGVTIPRPERAVPPSALHPGCRPLVLDAPDGVRLACWYADLGPTTPLAILFHGYSADKSSLIGEARALLDLGVSTLLVDFRGSGGSSESYTTLGVREAVDVETAFRHARQNFRHAGLVLFGQSMGAAAVLRAVRERGLQPDALVLEAVFDTLLNTVRRRFRAMRIPSFPCAELLVFWGGRPWAFDGFRHRPVDDAASVACPVLFLHGSEDPRATLAEARRVYDAAPGPKAFHRFDGVGHASYVSACPAEWRDTVAAFLRRHVGAVGGSGAAFDGFPVGGAGVVE